MGVERDTPKRSREDQGSRIKVQKGTTSTPESPLSVPYQGTTMNGPHDEQCPMSPLLSASSFRVTDPYGFQRLLQPVEHPHSAVLKVKALQNSFPLMLAAKPKHPFPTQTVTPKPFSGP